MFPQKPNKPKGFHVVWEDADLVVAHKGPGLLSVPDATESAALTGLLADFLSARDGVRVVVHPLHRLDKDVSGLLVFAKSARARDHLRRQFEAGLPERTYAALVRGRMREPEGTFRSYLDTKGLHPRSVAPSQGVPAVTHYRVIEAGHDTSLVEVKLETGRKNQIRVHFAESGHPLLGDRRFGGEEKHGFDRRRVALHAMQLKFQHPLDGRWLTFDDSLPPAFRRPFDEAQQRPAKAVPKTAPKTPAKISGTTKRPDRPAKRPGSRTPAPPARRPKKRR